LLREFFAELKESFIARR
jgi:hypothetical protein